MRACVFSRVATRYLTRDSANKQVTLWHCALLDGMKPGRKNKLWSLRDAACEVSLLPVGDGKWAKALELIEVMDLLEGGPRYSISVPNSFKKGHIYTSLKTRFLGSKTLFLTLPRTGILKCGFHGFWTSSSGSVFGGEWDSMDAFCQ